MPSWSWHVLPPTCRRDGFTAGNLKDHVLLWLSQSPGSLIYRSRGGITGQQWLWSVRWVKHVPDRSHKTVLKVNTFGKPAELWLNFDFCYLLDVWHQAYFCWNFSEAQYSCLWVNIVPISQSFCVYYKKWSMQRFGKIPDTSVNISVSLWIRE